MKITYMKLVNAASMYTGSNATEVEVDLSECYNRIVLIGGPNGCGKTSLLSCLHPFAYNGNLDDRSSEPLILTGKDGYKEIHIQNGQDEYLIKHFYASSHQTHTVKSYIMKNGVELNPNGNVSSFKELVSIELDLEMDFLSLIRLGSNVVNLIDKKPTERKNYMGNLLEEADIYLRYHKKVSADMKAFKTIIARDSDKLAKLNVTDVAREEEYLNELKTSTLDKYQREYERLRDRQSVLQFQLNSQMRPSEIREKAIVNANRRSEINRILSGKKFKSIPEDASTDDILDELIKAKSDLEVSTTQKSMLLADANDCSHELEDLRIKRRKIEQDEERTSYQKIIATLKDEIKTLESEFKGFKATYTSEDVTKLLELLEKLQTQLSTIYEIGDGPVKKVISLMRNAIRVEDYIERKRTSLYNNKIGASGNEVLEHLKGTLKQIKSSSGFKCNKSCPYRDVYDKLVSMADIKKDDDVESDDFYTYMQLAYTNISTVMKSIEQNSTLFIKMPEYVQKMFILSDVYSHIEKREWIYDIKPINDAMTAITDYELLQQKKEALKSARDALDKISDNTGLDFIEDRIRIVSSRLEADKCKISSLTLNISELSDKVNDLEHASELRKEKESLVTEHERLLAEFNELQSLLDTVSKQAVELNEINDKLNRTRDAINRINEDIKLIERRIDEYHFLVKDLKKVKEDYDDWELTRNSLSGKEGIPLIHIDVYLKKTRKIVNDLLDIIYNGNLRIDKFDITADTFRIPYIKNDRVIPDVKLASQGESSFITIALSFALSLQSISKYNIMLLDEIDSTLDENNREKFITILEKMMDMVDTEQIFLISHNNMFDMYPVDYLDMSKVKSGETIKPKAMH